MSNVLDRVFGAGTTMLRTLANPFRPKQQRMLTEARDALESGEPILLQASCITVRDIMEAPGIVQATDSKLLLTPCIGKPVSVSLDAITEVKETTWFNGRLRALEFQHGFWVKVPGKWRVGFAVTDPTPWQDFFRERGIAE